MNVQEQSVIIQFGKKGLSDKFIEETLKPLKRNTLVKIKLLKNSLEKTDRKKISQEIVKKISEKINIESKLVGNTLFVKKIRA